jgi:hypothetical protein
MPAIYSVAVSGSTRSAKNTLKNSQPRAAIVNGLISQFIVKVMTRPFGLFRISRIDPKSTCTIMG